MPAHTPFQKTRIRESKNAATKKVWGFKDRVLKVVKKIPKGKVLTYKEVAARAGNRGAARVVGNIMKANQDRSVPCHRVVGSNGKVGGYNGLRGNKAELLKKEGVRL